MRQCVYVHKLPFGIAIGSELSSKHAAGINTVGAVHRLHFQLGDMTVNDCCFPPVVGSPVQPYRKPIFIYLPSSFPIEAEISDLHGATTNILLFQTSMAYHELSIVQYIMADQPIQELFDLCTEGLIFFFKIGNRSIKTVRDLDVLPKQVFNKLNIMVSGDCKSVVRFDHFHNEPENFDIFRPTITQITKEDRLSSIGMDHTGIGILDIAELPKQHDKFVIAAMNIPDYIERTMLFLLVVPHPSTDDFNLIDFLLGVEDIDKTEALFFEVFNAASKVGSVFSDDVIRVSPFGTSCVPCQQIPFRKIQHDGHTMYVLLPCKVHYLLTSSRLYVCRIDDCCTHKVQALVCSIEKQIKCIAGNLLVVFVIRYHAPEEVRGEYLCRQKVFLCKGGFAAGRCANQCNECKLRYFYTHFLNTPICVGAPNASSTSPISLRSTVYP